MKISSLSEWIDVRETPLWWLVSRQYFAKDTLHCGVIAYKDYSGIPPLIKGVGGGIRLYNRLLQELNRYLESEYQAKIKKVMGQPRLCIVLPDGCCIQIAVRKAIPVEGGFECGECGPAMEQLSLLELETLDEAPGCRWAGAYFSLTLKPTNNQVAFRFGWHIAGVPKMATRLLLVTSACFSALSGICRRSASIVNRLARVRRSKSL